MELEFLQKIKKGESIKIPVPNFKNMCLLPTKLRFTNQELEFSLIAVNNTLIKYSEPYFHIYNEIELGDLMNKINDGEDLMMIIKNMNPKGEILFGVTVIYEKQLGNIIYTNTYYDNQINFDQCLDDIENAGQLTQLIIDAEVPISSVILDPIYKLRKQTKSAEGINDTDELDMTLLMNWSNSLAIQNSKPHNRIVIDFTDNDLTNYVKFLRFYRLKVIFADGDKVSNNPKMHILCYGYKSDKR